jgi:hypothetical protein
MLACPVLHLHATYGYSVPAGGMDELGRFKLEGAADSDEDRTEPERFAAVFTQRVST